MDPLEALHADHLAFRDRFASLERRLDDLVNGRSSRTGLLAALREDLDFMRVSLVPHFHREDTGLLLAVERHAGRYGDSMVDVLWQEHRELERAVAKFAEALDAAVAVTGDREVAELDRHGLFLVQVLQDHVRKEESAFFPLARQHLTPADWAEVGAAMDGLR